MSVASNLYAGPLYACVHELPADCVNFRFEQDGSSNAHYPFDRNNRLEVVLVASHLSWMISREAVNRLVARPTANVRMRQVVVRKGRSVSHLQQSASIAAQDLSLVGLAEVRLLQPVGGGPVRRERPIDGEEDAVDSDLGDATG